MNCADAGGGQVSLIEVEGSRATRRPRTSREAKKTQAVLQKRWMKRRDEVDEIKWMSLAMRMASDEWRVMGDVETCSSLGKDYTGGSACGSVGLGDRGAWERKDR